MQRGERRGRFRGVASVVAFLVLAVPGIAVAQATVEVEVRAASGTVDGRVTLVPRGQGSSRGCETERGRCTIDGVVGGRYTVRFVPKRGEAPPDRTVMIPPSGRVSLIVATGE